MNSTIDVAIVGAGSAGIAAARFLHRRGFAVLLVEALPWVGGRARTVETAGMALDFGCGWLHSADHNPLAVLAQAQGHPLDRTKAAWHRQLHHLHFSAADQKHGWAAYEQLMERLRERPPGSDCVGDALPREDRWRPFIDGLSSFINGTELEHLSAQDFLAYEDSASEVNWRLAGGYGAFIAEQGAGIPVALGTRVSTVSHAGKIVLETDRGAIRARAAIVAVSTDVLARGSISFDPPLPDHLHAASQLPLGVAEKVFLSVADPATVPPESHLLGRSDRAQTGSYYLRPFGRPVIECFLGGSWARALDEAGDRATVAFVTDELRTLLGADFAGGLAPLGITRWAHEPTIGGSYSHALPAHAGARAVLARPASAHLYFAGEACSTHDYSTAHGAWQTGIAAAEQVERALSPSSAGRTSAAD